MGEFRDIYKGKKHTHQNVKYTHKNNVITILTENIDWLKVRNCVTVLKYKIQVHVIYTRHILDTKTNEVLLVNYLKCYLGLHACYVRALLFSYSPNLYKRLSRLKVSKDVWR